MQLTGSGAIPKPIKGYKLVVKDLTNFANEGTYEYHKNLWVQPPFSEKTRWDNPTLFPNQELGKDGTWQLLPILDSGVWIDGKMALPKPQEGTYLLLEYHHDFAETLILKPKNGIWGRFCGNHFYTSDFPKPLSWMWISAPKN